MIVRVKEGEPLAAIARRYHTEEARIREENRLQQDPVEGMRLVVHGYVLHLWTPQDTVYEVARAYGVATERIESDPPPRVGRLVKIFV